MSASNSLIEELESALASGTPTHRLKAPWHITDLFIDGASQYSDEQIGLFDDVIEKLASEIEAKARTKLATRMAPIPNAPPKAVKALAFDDDIAVAWTVLITSDRLDD